ncbi:MAG: hypothetical protein J6P89_12630, partial [Oscillospiraceae bacterium]|nr:hypothetical protein [Oscillospiraceae bacterium]
GESPVSPVKLLFWGLLVFVTVVLLALVLSGGTGFAGSSGQSGFLFRSMGAGVLLGAVAAVAVCCAAVRSTRRTYESVPDTYAGDAETNFTTKLDRYVRQYTTKVKSK